MATLSRALALARQHARTGRMDLAEEIYRRILAEEPDHREAWRELGMLLWQQRRLGEATECLLRVTRLTPASGTAHNDLGRLLHEQGCVEQAMACYHRAIELDPEYGGAYNNLGVALAGLGHFDQALASYQRSMELQPREASVCHNLANALIETGRFSEAIACAQRATQLKPDFAAAYNRLAVALQRQGQIDEALACYAPAFQLNPGDVTSASNYLCLLRHHPDATLAALGAAHAEFERRHGLPLRPCRVGHGNSRDPERPLRLGFVAPAFIRVPLGAFLIQALEGLDRQEYPLVCYSGATTDSFTPRFRAVAERWRVIDTLTDEQVAAQIRDDGIDILFDLAGHDPGHRLLVFARKPAPIQITWVNCVGTTGLSAIDYVLADRHVIPSEAEPYYAERVLRMPDAYVCYDPPQDAPSVGPPPAQERGHVTFGSFNRPLKMHPKVIRVWSRILARLPDARLVLKGGEFEGSGTAARYTRLFAAEGIDPGRLEFEGSSPPDEYFRRYRQIDITLDPFPYSGGLTTCDSLWMGVPMVTWPGESFASRQSLSHLRSVGLTETIAESAEEYVELAVRLASDLPRLAALRAGLRCRVAESPLCDGKRFAANLTHVLREVWRNWCR
jgi:predicted O-linked N-acetylglucosamine transferase (SPINDLY family)